MQLRVLPHRGNGGHPTTRTAAPAIAQRRPDRPRSRHRRPLRQAAIHLAATPAIRNPFARFNASLRGEVGVKSCQPHDNSFSSNNGTLSALHR
jgi:hypothetical protein